MKMASNGGTDNATKWITAAAIVMVAIMCISMFFLGRNSVHIPEPAEVKHDTTYVPAPYPVHDTLWRPSPVQETPPPDTVYLPSPTDTAALFAVWRDYYATRDYDLDFSSDSLGVFKVATKVNQNKITEAVSTIRPITKVITNTETYYKERLIQPWVMVSTGVTDFKFQQIQTGVDINGKWMVGVGGMRYDKLGAVTVNVGCKF